MLCAIDEGFNAVIHLLPSIKSKWDAKAFSTPLLLLKRKKKKNADSLKLHPAFLIKSILLGPGAAHALGHQKGAAQTRPPWDVSFRGPVFPLSGKIAPNLPFYYLLCSSIIEERNFVKRKDLKTFWETP